MNVGKDVKSTTFKYNNVDDRRIYDALENKAIDKSQLIKNALYHYIVKVQSGEILDRNLPQEENVKEKSNLPKSVEDLLAVMLGGKFKDSANELISEKEELQEEVKKDVDNKPEEENNDSDEIVLEIPNEFDDLDDDNFDMI